MTIQIDRSEFLPEIENYASTHKRGFKQQSLELSEEVLDKAQEFFDAQPWLDGDVSHYETALQTRVTMKLWIYDRIDLKSEDKAWFVPSFIWYWVASRLISYIVKILIERYWPKLYLEIPNEND